MKLSSGAWADIIVYMTNTVPLEYWYILGGVTVNALRNVQFGVEDRTITMCVAADVTVIAEEHDFCASFDPVTKC